MKIVIDTREQEPLVFRKSKYVEGTVVKTLKTGDYSIEGHENRIAFERKSLSDLYGTVGKGHKRFQKELERARNMDYFAVIVEAPFHAALVKDFPEAKYTRLRGDVVIKILMTIKMKYGVDVIFAQDRGEASTIIRHIFRAYLDNLADPYAKLLRKVRKFKHKHKIR